MYQFLTSLFRGFALPFQPFKVTNVEQGLTDALKSKFSTPELKALVNEELIKFITSPDLHGKYENDDHERPGYFASFPYTPAFNLYFMRTAVHPRQMEENFRKLILDINHYAERIYNSNSRKPDMDKLVIHKPSMQIGVGYYPTRQYMEGVIRPYMERLGVSVDAIMNHPMGHDYDSYYLP